MENLLKSTVKNQRHIFCLKLQGRKFSSLTGLVFFAAILFGFTVLLTSCGDDNSDIPVGGTILSSDDPVPPTNTTTGKVINTGAVATTTVSGYLTISATDNVGVTGYCAKEDPATPLLADPCWETIVSTTSYLAMVPFTLSAGNGTKTVYVWFRDGEGANVSNSASDDIIVNSDAQFLSVSAGNGHSIAVDSFDQVWGWGANSTGQVGDGSTSQRDNPTKVKVSDGSNLTNAAAVAAGYSHSIALLNNTTVWAWGNNGSGQVGDGTTIRKETAVRVKIDVLTPLVGVIAIAAGGNHSLAVKSDGTVWAWGLNSNGQLGQGGGNSFYASKVTDDLGVDLIVDTSSGVSIAAGASHSLLLEGDGTLWAWGWNFEGQIGDGTKMNRYYPVLVKGGGGETDFSGSIAIDAGGSGSTVGSFTVALQSDGTVWSWGHNQFAQLGIDRAGCCFYPSGSDYPVHVVKGASSGDTEFLGDNPANPVTAISAGQYHTQALKQDGTVWGWGSGTIGDGVAGSPKRLPVQVVRGTSSGDTTYLGDQLLPSPNPVTATAAGASHSLALKNDGTVWAWGNNSWGQLGDGTNGFRTAPVQVKSTDGLGLLINVIAIGAGNRHSIAVLNTGEVLAWGYNGTGQLGDNSTTNSSLPVYVLKSDLTNLNIGTTGISVDGGFGHSLALASNGDVWAWGSNSRGQLGDGTNSQKITAVQVTGEGGIGFLNISGGSISAGINDHSLALTSGGTIAWAWGSNLYGELGDGTGGGGTNKNSPVRIKNTDNSDFTGAIGIAAGYNHSVAITNDQGSWGWGRNDYGQLGDGTRVDKWNPGPVKNNDGGPFTNAIAIAAGERHSLLIKDDGFNDATVWSWGNGSNGKLGHGGTVPSTIPFIVKYSGGSDFPSGGSDAIAIAAGQNHSLAIIDDGITKTVWAWGRNNSGQTGTGIGTTSGSIYYPLPTKNNDGSDFTGVNNVIGAGYNHSLATKDDLSLWTWGSNNQGQIGDGTSGSGNNRPDPIQTQLVPAATDVADGGHHTIVLDGGETLRAMGFNDFGQVGEGPTSTSYEEDEPVPVKDFSNQTFVNAMEIAAGYAHSVALKTDTSVWSWGYNKYGQLGYGMDGETNVSDMQQSAAVQVLDETGLSFLTGISAVAAGGEHTLAIKSDSTVVAWGRDYEGELGNTTVTTFSNLPVQVDRGASITDTTYLGDDVLNPVIAIAAGFSHSLALKEDGTVWSWGENEFGQLGDGTITNSDTPVEVTGLINIISISAGAFHSVALMNDGTVWVWGYNILGQLGDGTTTDSHVPIQALDDTGFVPLAGIIDIAAGQYHTVAMKYEWALPVSIWAWGLNDPGQLGDSSTTNSSLPVQVVGEGGVGFLTDIISLSAGDSFTMGLTNDWSIIWGWGDNSNGQLGASSTSTPASVTTPVKMDI